MHTVDIDAELFSLVLGVSMFANCDGLSLSGSRWQVWYTLYNFCCLSIKALVQAQPVNVGHAVAIQPSNAPLTVPDAPRLTLNERSASRQAFDAALAQKQKQAEVILLARLHA